ncbi:hypothetical protein [Streptomyces sp. NPDC051576]|uniref:hypothetical protein n=1 Tax=Streptomyces sp. NPDC051576 TaxID=3155803 RepID=UPI0034284FF9
MYGLSPPWCSSASRCPARVTTGRWYGSWRRRLARRRSWATSCDAGQPVEMFVRYGRWFAEELVPEVERDWTRPPRP